MIVEPGGAFEGTVTLTWAFPLLSVKACIGVTYVEVNVVGGPEGGMSIALKSIRTFCRGELSCTWKVTV